jgi:hypothetical protein
MRVGRASTMVIAVPTFSSVAIGFDAQSGSADATLHSCDPSRFARWCGERRRFTRRGRARTAAEPDQN